MKFSGLVASTVALSAANVCASTVQPVKRDLQAVTTRGNGSSHLSLQLHVECHANYYIAFFVGDKRFYVRGIDYQPGTIVNAVNVTALY